MSDQLDEVLQIDISDLTISEVCEIEDRTGLPLDALGSPEHPKGRMLQALAYVIKRRENPDYTWEQAGALKINTTSAKVPPVEGDE